MLDKLRQTLELFERCSEQKINWEKLALCGVNVEESKLLSTASRLNCKANYLHFTYLRLPLGGYPKRVSFWQPMIDKTHTKLDKWRKFNLSRGGRSTLCKSVLSNLPTYYMSLFLMPEKVISILERIMRNFFWEGHKGSKINHLVKWNLVIKPRIDEGLGFGGLKAKNLALLAKWGWRYLNEENSLWSQVVRSIHGTFSLNVALLFSVGGVSSPFSRLLGCLVRTFVTMLVNF